MQALEGPILAGIYRPQMKTLLELVSTLAFPGFLPISVILLVHYSPCAV